MMVPAKHWYIVGIEDQNIAAKSQSGINAGDDGPAIVPDLTIIPGTLIRGQFRLGPEARPVPGQEILLGQLGEEHGGEDERHVQESLTRRVETDRDGRFAFRVGPGEYEVIVIQDAQIDQFRRTVTDEKAIEMDLHLVAGGTRLTGQVVERRNGATKPVPVPAAVVMTLQGKTFWSGRGAYRREGPLRDNRAVARGLPQGGRATLRP